jgi:hypothetical protein
METNVESPRFFFMAFPLSIFVAVILNSCLYKNGMLLTSSLLLLGKTETDDKKLIHSARNSGLKVVQYFFRDGVEEMMRNASCFLISFHASLLDLSVKISYFAYKCTQNG